MTEKMLIFLSYQQRHSGVRGQATPISWDPLRHLYEVASSSSAPSYCYAHIFPASLTAVTRTRRRHAKVTSVLFSAITAGFPAILGATTRLAYE